MPIELADPQTGCFWLLEMSIAVAVTFARPESVGWSYDDYADQVGLLFDGYLA